MHSDVIRHLCQKSELPPAATEWVCSMWHVIQVMDDFADGGVVMRADLDKCILDALVMMPGNAFFKAHSDWLLPGILSAVIKWQASDIAERAGKADAKSYMWRAGFYDLFSLVCALVHGPSSVKAIEALSFYGETFDEYMREFS